MYLISVTKVLRDNIWSDRTILCLAAFISYASIWNNQFVFDDIHLIAGNEFLRHWDSLPKLLTSMSYAGYGIAGGFYRPVQMLLYFLLYQVFGLSPIAFHALNISLHILNACLLHSFGRRAGFNKGAVFVAALLWAVHPLHAVDVAFMASTAELLWGTFCLLGLIALLPDFTLGKILKAMIFFLLALCSKESAVVFPALAAVTLFFVAKERVPLSVYLKTWPLWVLSACYVAVWLWVMHKFGRDVTGAGDPAYFEAYTFNFKNRLLTSLATLPVYAGLIVWPVGLHVERVPEVSTTMLAWLPLMGTLIAGLGLWQIFQKGQLALRFGLLWYIVALAPYTGITIPIDALLSEGWLYVPTMGLFLAVAQTTAVFFEKRQNVTCLLVLAMFIPLSITTFIHSTAWRNTETLYQDTLQNGGYVVRLSSYLGKYYMEHGEFDKAIHQFQYVLDHPQGSHWTGTGDTHLQLAMAWLQISSSTVTINDVARALPSCHHIGEVIAELGKVLQNDPNFYWAHQALVAIYRYQGNNQMADFHDKKVREILQRRGG